MFNKQFYTDKLQKLQQKNLKLCQQYINDGIKFGQDIAELDAEAGEINKLIAENEPKTAIEKQPAVVPPAVVPPVVENQKPVKENKAKK